MKILFKFATRSRPQKFLEHISNIFKTIADNDNYLIIVSADNDDNSMRDYRANPFDKNIIIFHGTSQNKIHAINRDIEKASAWDILINTSDDMVFTQQGFDNIIREDMNKYFPDLNGFLHYNDGNQKSNVCTMSIMGRKYYERFGYIYNPEYKSVWCDVEQTEVAHLLGKHKYMGDEKVLFRHMHPAWGLSDYDEQYRKSENLDVWGEDLKTLLERKMRNYDLPPEQIVNGVKYPPSEMIKWQKELNATRQHNGLTAIEF